MSMKRFHKRGRNSQEFIWRNVLSCFPTWAPDEPVLSLQMTVGVNFPTWAPDEPVLSLQMTVGVKQEVREGRKTRDGGFH